VTKADFDSLSHEHQIFAKLLMDILAAVQDLNRMIDAEQAKVRELQ